jgi:hypothetical protein
MKKKGDAAKNLLNLKLARRKLCDELANQPYSNAFNKLARTLARALLAALRQRRARLAGRAKNKTSHTSDLYACRMAILQWALGLSTHIIH